MGDANSTPVKKSKESEQFEKERLQRLEKRKVWEEEEKERKIRDDERKLRKQKCIEERMQQALETEKRKRDKLRREGEEIKRKKDEEYQLLKEKSDKFLKRQRAEKEALKKREDDELNDLFVDLNEVSDLNEEILTDLTLKADDTDLPDNKNILYHMEKETYIEPPFRPIQNTPHIRINESDVNVKSSHIPDSLNVDDNNDHVQIRKDNISNDDNKENREDNVWSSIRKLRENQQVIINKETNGIARITNDNICDMIGNITSAIEKRKFSKPHDNSHELALNPPSEEISNIEIREKSYFSKPTEVESVKEFNYEAWKLEISKIFQEEPTFELKKSAEEEAYLSNLKMKIQDDVKKRMKESTKKDNKSTSPLDEKVDLKEQQSNSQQGKENE